MASPIDTLLEPPVFVAVYGGLLVVYLGLKARLRRSSADAGAGFERPAAGGVRTLLEDLARGSAGQRAVARRRLADEGGPERALTLRILEEGSDPEALLLALRAAGDLKLRDAVPLAGRLLSHGDPRLATAAAETLGAIGDPAGLAWLLDGERRLDSELKTGLAEPKAPLSSSFPSLPSPSPLPAPPSSSPPSFAASPSPPPGLLDRILPPLAERNFRILDRHTPYGLGKLDEGGLVDVLLAVARDDEETTAHRYHAIRNLALYRRRDLLEDAAAFLASDVPALRFAAADTVAELGGADGATALLRALQDSNAYVRSAAAAGLARLGDDRCLVPLMNLRRDADEVVRYTAERALADLARRKDVGALLTRPTPEAERTPAPTPSGTGRGAPGSRS